MHFDPSLCINELLSKEKKDEKAEFLTYFRIRCKKYDQNFDEIIHGTLVPRTVSISGFCYICYYFLITFDYTLSFNGNMPREISVEITPQSKLT